jgi:hypothetical protein
VDSPEGFSSGCCECGDEPSGSGATELEWVSVRSTRAAERIYVNFDIG